MLLLPPLHRIKFSVGTDMHRQTEIKERKNIYIAPFLVCHTRKALKTWITQFHLQITSCLSSFVSVHQMALPLTEVADIQLQLTTHLFTPKGWKAELAWLVDPPSHLATTDMGQKLGGDRALFGGELGPHLTQICLGWGYLHTKWHLNSRHFATTDIGRKLWGGCAPLGGELGPHLTHVAWACLLYTSPSPRD